jgi:hypothetical protein
MYRQRPQHRDWDLHRKQHQHRDRDWQQYAEDVLEDLDPRVEWIRLGRLSSQARSRLNDREEDRVEPTRSSGPLSQAKATSGNSNYHCLKTQQVDFLIELGQIEQWKQ